MNRNMTFDSMMDNTLHCKVIFTELFFRQKTLTAKEIAKVLGTTTNSVRSRISEIRNLGFTVRCLTNDGKNFAYSSDFPQPDEVANARRVGLAGFYHPEPLRVDGDIEIDHV